MSMAKCLWERFCLQSAGFYRHKSWMHMRRLGVRTLLSDAHLGKEAWSARLQAPLLQKVNVADFAIQIQGKIDKKAAMAIDMDILANKLEQLDPQQLDFVQNLYNRFRHTNETIKAREPMSHAILRALVDMGETERLLEILQDKLNYGIFLDDFSANYVLDYFIEQQQYQGAAKVAFDLMLQEDLAHPVTRWLSWYACHKHWKNPPPATEPEVQEQEEEEEIQWIPINFIRNPWYDDQWDISKDSLLLGKTFTMVSRHEKGFLGTSYTLIGHGLHEKFDDGIKLMSEWIKSADKPSVAREATESFLETLENVETKEEPTEPLDPGSVTLEDVKPFVSAEQKEQLLMQAKECVNRLESQNQVSYEPLESLLLENVKKTIAILEPKDIEDQNVLFNRWITERQDEVDIQVEAKRQQERREAIGQKLRDLQTREEKLRYFEQQEKILLGMSRAPKIRPLEDVVEEEQFVAAPMERGRSY